MKNLISTFKPFRTWWIIELWCSAALIR